jgi:hypothetical protein
MILGAIAITGDLDLNAAIGNGATAGATSLSVSGTTNIGANITTTTTQTFTGAVTLSVDTTLRGTTIYTQSTVSGSGGGTSVSTTGTTGWIDQNGNSFSNINGSGTVLLKLIIMEFMEQMMKVMKQYFVVLIMQQEVQKHIIQIKQVK